MVSIVEREMHEAQAELEEFEMNLRQARRFREVEEQVGYSVKDAKVKLRVAEEKLKEVQYAFNKAQARVTIPKNLLYDRIKNDLLTPTQTPSEDEATEFEFSFTKRDQKD